MAWEHREVRAGVVPGPGNLGMQPRTFLSLLGWSETETPGLGLPVGSQPDSGGPGGWPQGPFRSLDSWQLRPNLLCVASPQSLERELPFPRCLDGSILVPHPSRLGCCLTSGPFLCSWSLCFSFWHFNPSPPPSPSILSSPVHLLLLREAWGLGTRWAAVDWIDSTEIYYQVIKPIYSHSHWRKWASLRGILRGMVEMASGLRASREMEIWA